MIRKTKDLPPDVTRDLHATSHQRSHKTTILPATDATARPRTEARSAAASVLSQTTAEKRNRFHEYFQYKQKLLAAAGQCEARRGCVPSEVAAEDYRFRVTAPCYMPRATCRCRFRDACPVSMAHLDLGSLATNNISWKMMTPFRPESDRDENVFSRWGTSVAVSMMTMILQFM